MTGVIIKNSLHVYQKIIKRDPILKVLLDLFTTETHVRHSNIIWLRPFVILR